MRRSSLSVRNIFGRKRRGKKKGEGGTASARQQAASGDFKSQDFTPESPPQSSEEHQLTTGGTASSSVQSNLATSTAAGTSAGNSQNSLHSSKQEDTTHHSNNNNNSVSMGPEKKPETDSLLGSTVAAHPDPHSLSDPSNNNGTAGGGAFADSSAGDAPNVTKAYDEIPVLEQTKLPRGGVSVETSAVGRIQFGIPPETIKDSMRLGIPVPQVYIVPVERFCREMGPALGVNLAEFEFPAYFNFFVYKKRCTLVVDSSDAEDNIRRVFSETLLGPAQFRDGKDPIAYEPEDFAPDYPQDQIPNFQKELQHFRIMPDGKELVIETLLDFRHFHTHFEGQDTLGVPPPAGDCELLVETSEAAAERAVEEMYGAGGVGTASDDEDMPEEAVPQDEQGVEQREVKTPWTYSHAKFSGEVATVWPSSATEEQKQQKSVPRVEIFKMPGGTEYIIHDVNEQNHIVGKARVLGHVKVSESMSVDGFGGHSFLDDLVPQKKPPPPPPPEIEDVEMTQDSEASHGLEEMFPQVSAPPTFHPPSFGVTVLGNSHGFDKSGSVSGYVLWINGRGVMIDPPPYSSATLEKEGIRPRTIVGIILTHCHADHDAGAFQKVLTGTPVVVITTPTIYKSFIRKYAALSALSPALLRHSHRYKPAIIGQPLRFQGATFHFIYSLHTIPCIGFRVEWRGRSMVFTGDHFNSPTGMKKLTESGVLTPARAEDLKNLALQECDLLLHEAGAPPIHTPLEVLLQLPPEVKKRLYVVHTSTLPDDCELKAAPTGTKGTIRLDQLDQASNNSTRSLKGSGDDEYDGTWNGPEYETIEEEPSPMKKIPAHHRQIHSSFANLEMPTNTGSRKGRNSVFYSPPGNNPMTPLVALRPASSTDAWFILNLLSAVPFISSLSYTSTMELLETARVDAYKQNDIILPSSRRSTYLCVVWEGTCSEVPTTSPAGLKTIKEHRTSRPPAVWHAGDWTGPISLQPDRVLSGDSLTSKTHDVVAVSFEGVKVISVDIASLHSILKSGSPLYKKYLDRQSQQNRAKMDTASSKRLSSTTEKLLDDARKEMNVLELLNCNSAFRKLNAVQKRHLESLAEGPVSFQPGERLWRAGYPVEKAFVIVSGSASFVPPRRHRSGASPSYVNSADGGEQSPLHIDMHKAVKELGKVAASSPYDEAASLSSMEHDEAKPAAVALDRVFNKGGVGDAAAADAHTHDIEKLKQGLERRANHVNTATGDSVNSEDLSLLESHESDTDESQQHESHLDYTFTDEADSGFRSKRSSVIRRRSSRARKANKVLGRLYNRRAFTGGLVFSRGHFLGDVSKMVAGLLSIDNDGELQANADDGPAYGFGDQAEGSPDESLPDTIAGSTIPEEGEQQQITHSSTLTAGKDGCVVLVFPKSSLIPFLDQFPGLLLSLLGTQVVV